MNSQALEVLLRDFLSAASALMQSGEELDDDFYGEMTKTLSLLWDRLQQAREAESQQEDLEEAEEEQAQVAGDLEPEVPPPSIPTGEPIPPLEPAPHESSNINAFRYNPETKELFVKFQDKYPGTNGPVYVYDKVPKNIFKMFARGSVKPKTSGSNAWHTWHKNQTPSHGASMYALIRGGGYPYRKVS
jgi:hypothetical protein